MAPKLGSPLNNPTSTQAEMTVDLNETTYEPIKNIFAPIEWEMMNNSAFE